MLHLRSFTGFSIHLERWNAFRFGQQGRPLNVRLRRPLDVISGRPQDVRLGRPRDVRSGRPRDGQIGSLGTSWGRWRGTSSGRPGDQYLLAGSITAICLNNIIISIIIISWTHVIKVRYCYILYGNNIFSKPGNS